jgi:hypothetical protein
MKIALPSIIFALVGTTASAGLRKHREPQNVASEGEDVQSLRILSAGANGKQQHAKAHAGDFSVRNANQQQGKNDTKDYRNVGGEQSDVREFPYFG